MAYAPEQDDASVIAAPASADPYIAAAPPAQATARPSASAPASARGNSVKSKGKKDKGKEKEKEKVKKDKEQKQEPGRDIGTDKHHLIINTKMSVSGTSGSPDHLRPNSAQQYHHPHHQHHQHQHHQRSTSGHGTPTSATMPHTPYSSTHPLSLDIDPSIAGAGAGQGYGPSGPITPVSGNGNGAGESSYSAPASASASASASGQPSASYYGSAALSHPHTHTQMHPPPDDGRISPAAGAAVGGGPGSASASADGRPTSENFTQDGNPIVPVGISGGKMFQCRGYGACDKVFTRSEHLARHVRKHTGERPFPCHCGKAFSRLDNLRQHAATVHADATVLNEAMLQSLTPVHSALSNRASREQRRRGEIVEVPKNAVERPRHNDHRKDGPGSLTGQAAMGMGGGGGPPDIVVGAYPPYGETHMHPHQQHQGHGGWEGQQSSVPPPDEGEGQPDGLGRHGHGHGHGMPPPQAMHHAYDYPYSSHQQHPHSLHAHLSDDGRRQASPATPSYGYTHHQPQHQQGHGQYFPDRPTPDGHLQQQQQQHFYRPLSASGYHGGSGGPGQVSDESGQRQGQGSQPPPSPLYPPGTHQHAQHNQHQHAQWSTPPPPSAYPHDQHPNHHQPSQSQSQSHLYAPQGHNGNGTSPAPEMGYPQQPHSPLPPHMQSHHAQHGYGQPQQPPTPGPASASLGPESSHSQAPPGAGQGQNAGQGQGYGYPPAGGYYGPSHPYGHAQAHTPTGPGPYGSQQQHYFGGASNPPHSPLPFAYGQPGMQHTPVATPLHLPSHALPPQGHEYQQPQQQQQQGVQDFAYPQAGDGPGSDRKRRADGPDEYGARSKMPRLSSETRHDSDQGRGGDKGFLGVPQHQHHHQQGYHSGSVSPLPGHMSIPPSTSSSMHEQSNGVGASDSGNTSHVHVNGNTGHSNHNNGVNNGHSNSHSIPTNHASSNNNNNNTNGWPNNDNDDGELWFPPVTERRSSLAISALLGSPQPETKRLPNSMAMSAMTANAAQVASQAANGAGGVKTEGA